MTVQTSTNVASFNGDGANKVFPIGYKFNSAADLVVTLIDDDAKTTQILTLNSDFTVTGAGDEEGGAVTLAVAPTVVQRLKVTRVVDILQLTDLRNQGKFYAEIHEDAFDLLTMIAQQHQSDIASSLRVAETDPEPARIPSVAQRAGKLLAFDAAGNPTTALPVADSSTELRQELAANSGAGLIGWSRTALVDGVSTVAERLSATALNIWEFAGHVVSKPDPLDPATWDWSPAFAAAITAAEGGRIVVPNLGQVYSFVQIVVPSSVEIVGEGMAELRQLSGSDRTGLSVTGAGAEVRLVGLTLNQNNTGQTFGSGKFLINSEVGGINLILENCLLKDFCEGAVRVRGDKDTATRDRLVIRNSAFRGGTASESGVYNTFTVFAADGAELIVDGCDFDHGLTTINQGISAIAIAGVDTSVASYTKVQITNNQFRGYGRFTDGSGVGVIDAYAWAEDVNISNNLFISSRVTPIRGKVNARNMTITGNQMNSFVDVGEGYGGGIHLVSATLAPVSGRYVITDNMISNCPYRGIEVSSADTAPQNILISGNIVDSAGDIGIYLNKATSFHVCDNIVKNAGAQGIAFAGCDGLAMIRGNMVNYAGGAGIGSVGEQPDLSIDISNNEVFASTATGIFAEQVNFVSLANNLVRSVTDGGTLGQRAFRVGGNSGVAVAQIKGNTALGSYIHGFLQVTGAGVTSLYEYGNTWNRKESWGSGAPTAGSWARNDVVWNTAASAGGTIGWVCTAAGTPGTWKSFGAISA